VDSTPSAALTERKALSIFLTGATSPLGQVVTRKLTAAGHQVTGVAEDATRAALLRNNGGLPIYADVSRVGELKNAITFRKAEIVINLGSQFPNHIPFMKSAWDSEGEVLLKNTEALVTAAAAAGATFYLHTSYAFVYGDRHGAWVDETSRPEPGDQPFLKAALHAEKKALSAAIPACVLRLGYLYGAEVTELHELTDTLLGARLPATSEGYANWIDLGDAAEAIRRAAEARIAGGIYNIVDSAPASSHDFLKHFATALGLQSGTGMPAFLERFLPAAPQIGLPGISVRAKNARAIADLGWTPRFNDHIAGIEDTLLSWRAAEAVR
jgi:nucleoside-diphosphate-sugar epimerase